MSRTATIITPADHGRRMSLAEFEHAEAQEGQLYELGKGEVIVVDVPNDPHGAQIDALREQLYGYRVSHRGIVQRIYTGAECKVVITGHESERHPDLAIYKTPPPGRGHDVWSIWIPEIVVEVVSPGSEHRDYIEKREEYLAFGVQEYWISDAARQEITVLQRRAGLWIEHRLLPGQTHRTHLLPDFELDIAAILSAGQHR
jgi:Uma2 family endonuclease